MSKFTQTNVGPNARGIQIVPRGQEDQFTQTSVNGGQSIRIVVEEEEVPRDRRGQGPSFTQNIMGGHGNVIHQGPVIIVKKTG